MFVFVCTHLSGFVRTVHVCMNSTQGFVDKTLVVSQMTEGLGERWTEKERDRNGGEVCVSELVFRTLCVCTLFFSVFV